MDINVSVSPEHVDTKATDGVENTATVSAATDTIERNSSSHAHASANHNLQEKLPNDTNRDSTNTLNPFLLPDIDMSHEMDQNFSNKQKEGILNTTFSVPSNSPADEEEDDDDEMEDEYDMHPGNDSGNNGQGLDMSSMMMPNMAHHGFDDIQFFPPSQHRSLRLQPQFQFHQDQLNDPNYHYASNLSSFDASGLVGLSGNVNNSFSLISDSTGGDINNAFSESPFVFPDNVMEYGEPQFFPGNCVGYLETILEEDDEEYEEEEGCSGRHWWTADSDTDTDSVIRVDNNGQTPCSKSSTCQAAQGNTNPGEKDEVKPHFRSSASSKPFELEDLHLFDQLDHAFEETLREPRRRSGFACGHQSQSVEQSVESNKGKASLNATAGSLTPTPQIVNGTRCQKSGVSSNHHDKTATAHSRHVFIESTNNDEETNEMTTKGLKMLTQENVKAHSEENSKIIYEVGEEKEQSSKKLGNAESRETFGSSLSPSSSDSEAPAEVAEEDFFYSSPGSEEEECRSQEETESEESCSSDDSGKKGVVLAEFSLGSAGNGGGSGGFGSSGVMFGSSRNRRSFESPSRLKSFRSFDSLNCLAGTELLFSKPDTFPSIHHIKEVSEPNSESESSNEVSAADDRGLIPEEDEEEGDNNGIILTHREGTQSLPSQHSDSSTEFPGPSLTHQINSKNSASSSTSTVSSTASGSGLRSTENLSEDSGIGNDGVSSTAASTPGAFIEDANGITPNGRQGSDCNKKNISLSVTAAASEAEADANLLTAESSAKEYISRAEFALNPFVYSSLSSSEPESSINSAPSLTCNNSSNTSQDPVPSNLRTEDESLLPSGNKFAERKEDNQTNDCQHKDFATVSTNITHKLILDSNDAKTEELQPIQNERTNCMNSEEDRLLDASDTKKASVVMNSTDEICGIDRIASTPTTQPPATCVLSASKHADNVAGTDSLSESGNSTPGPHSNMTNDTIPLESAGLHPQLNPPHSLIQAKSFQSTSPKSQEKGAEDCIQSTLSGPTSSDCAQDKHELANNSIPGTNTVGQHSIPSNSALNSSFPVTAPILVPDANNPCASRNTDELANTSTSPRSTQLPVTAINSSCGINKTSNDRGPPQAHNVREKQTPEPDSVDFTVQQMQMCEMEMMDGNSSKQRMLKSSEHPHSNIISSVTNASSAPLSQTQDSQLTCLPSQNEPTKLSNSQSDYEECVKNSITKTKNSSFSSQELPLCMSNGDAEEERKHAPLQLSSSSPLSSVVDNSFSSCSLPLEQEPQNHGYSSSSSSDEQSESYQPRFHRQRSDSESEYEAAESAVERNNVDMAYDIIVNSPSKKALAVASSPISSVSGVTGATSDISTSLFHGMPLSLANEQLSLSSNTNCAAAPSAEHHSQSQSGMDGNKCNWKSGPVSTLSSLINIHHNDMHTSSEDEDNMRNDKRLPVFESSIDDYDDDHVIDSTALVATALPISKNMRATSSTPAVVQANNIIASTTPMTSCAHSSYIHAPSHEDGQRAGSGKQLQSTREQASSSSPLLEQPYHVMGNTSFLLHQQQQNENSDELTQAQFPQSHFHGACNSNIALEHRDAIVFGESSNKNKNFCDADETQQKQHQQYHPRVHQDQHNVLRSVTLDDSTSADVAHNLQLNQTQKPNNTSTSHPAGVALKSNTHHSQPPTLQVDHGTSELAGTESNNKDYHRHNKLVTGEPYCPNQIGVAQVKKFTQSGYVGTKECASFSGPVEPPSSSSCAEKESHEKNNKQAGEGEQWNGTQSAKSPILSQTANYTNSTQLTATQASASNTSPESTTEKQGVILGDSNFGFFGCSSHSRGGGNRAVAYESHEASAVAGYVYSSSSDVLPQVNLDLHSISASESGFSPGYGFPCSPPISQGAHLQQDGLQEERLRKGNSQALLATSVDTFSTKSTNKRSLSPSSFAATKAAPESSKEFSKASARKDHQHNQQHLHREDIRLYAGIDKFSVPLGAIKAAVVAVVPTIPTYIVRPSSGKEQQHSGFDPTAERSTPGKTLNSNTSLVQQVTGVDQGTYIPCEVNGTLSTPFPKGTANKTCNSHSILSKRGENNETQDKATQPSTSVPDILIVKQFTRMQSDSEEEVQHKVSRKGGMELDTETPSTNGSSGKRVQNTQSNTERNIESISSSGEMLRSDSPIGSSAPTGIPHKTKTYGPRNEVEVVVVSSRTPSPAPGGFASTSSSSSSSRKLPSSSLSTSSGQVRNEPSTSSSHQQQQQSEEESAFRESSIPPPPSSPITAPSAKATRSRVHFSPVVSEISWRESYIDQSSECSGSTEDLLAKLENLDVDGNPIVGNPARAKRSAATTATFLDNSDSVCSSTSANLRKAGASAAAAVVAGSTTTGYSGDIKFYAGDEVNSEVGGSSVRPLQVYDIQMSTRADSPSGLISTRGPIPSGKGPILVEKVEMTSSPLHDREQEEEVDRVLGASQSSGKLPLPVEDEAEDAVDNDPERVTDLVDFRTNFGANKGNGSNRYTDHNNGTLGLYEDVEVQIEPPTKMHGSTTLSMVPDLLSQCENNHILTHIDVRIEETIPESLNNKNIVLNIGPPHNSHKEHKKDHVQPQKSKSLSPEPKEGSPEPRQILPKMFAEDNKNDFKRNSSSSLSSTSKGKKSSKGFLIQGLGSAGKKSDKDNGRDATNGNGTNTSVSPSTTNGDGKEKEIASADATKENKKASKPGFFERLSKIRLSSGSKNKKQKVHPKADEIHQEAAASGTPAVTNIEGITAVSRPLRSANSVNVNGSTSNKNYNSGANSSSLPTNHSGGVQPILKKSPASSSTIPGVRQQYNGKDMGIVGDSENEPDEATQAFENILEEIAGLKSIQLRKEKSSNGSIDKSPASSQQIRSFAKRKQFYTNTSSPSPPVSPNSQSYSDLDSKLSQFKEDTSRNLDAISKSHPDLEIIEDAVKQRQKSLSPEPTKHVESRPLASTLPKPSSSSAYSSKSASEAAQNSEREWYRLLKSAAEKYSYHKGPNDEHFVRESALSHKTGIVETDLDTGASREMLDEDMLQLDCKVPCYTVSTSEIPTSASAASTTVSIAASAGSPGTSTKTRSLTNLSTRLPLSIAPSQFDESTGDLSDSEDRAKSLEFLLDDNHKSSSVPPENKLRLENRQLSEHELRIQRSLQRINVPEWYKQHGTMSTGTNIMSTGIVPQNKAGTLNILKRSEYGSSGGLAGGWTGLSTFKAPSMSSLQSNSGRNSGTLPLGKSNFVRGRPATMSVTRASKESLATGSASHSPSAFERSSFTYGMPFTMTRFGHGRLSTHSGSVSPPSTPDSTTKPSTYIKKPYLGWRSQERLNAANTTTGVGNTSVPKLSIYLPPAERLAADLIAARAKSPQPPVRPPLSDRPPLPKAPPRAERTVPAKAQDDLTGTPGAHSSSPVISKQESSLAVVTKIPHGNYSNPPTEFPLDDLDSSQSHSHKKQSTKVSPNVHDSIRQVTSAISHYVNRDHGGQSQRNVKPKTGKKQAIWIESSFVGQKPPSK